jgi:rare lipoprotein A
VAKPSHILALMMAVSVPCQAVDRPSPRPDPDATADYEQAGKASYYGIRHEGQRTANGEEFKSDDFTAAHPSLPFGTVARITNPANGRVVKVRISDRGPHTRSRIVDLSEAAARQLGMFRRGIARVIVQVFKSDQP